ncbi:MAG: hypothetical protein AAF721_32580 [Myxococcota bacterium]
MQWFAGLRWKGTRTMRTGNSSNLIFLLSLAPLSVGCVASDDGTDTDANGTSTGGTDEGGTATTLNNPTTTPNETGAPMDTGTTAADPTGAVDSTSAGMTGSTGVPMDTGTDTGTDTGGAATACAEYAEWIADCYGYDEEYVDMATLACEQDLAGLAINYSEDCASAVEDAYACVSGIDCRLPKGACEKEDAAVQAICMFPDDTGETGPFTTSAGGSSDQ